MYPLTLGASIGRAAPTARTDGTRLAALQRPFLTVKGNTCRVKRGVARRAGSDAGAGADEVDPEVLAFNGLNDLPVDKESFSRVEVEALLAQALLERGSPDFRSTDSGEDVLEVLDIREKLEQQDSPFVQDNNAGAGFVGDRDRVTLHSVKFENQDSTGATYGLQADAGTLDKDEVHNLKGGNLPRWALRSGPRRDIYFDPKKTTAAIVTCGGLCPGLNDVVQNIVYTLIDYGVPDDNIIGIRYGLRGFYEGDYKPIQLTREVVDGIHLKGGTILGTSRGGADVKQIVKKVEMWGLDMVFVIGGNGGNAAANAIQEECTNQGVTAVIAGVPKSIDNDILLIDRCFGFETATHEAQAALLAAKVEARSARNGIGLVKLMGRSSGFIAMQASMASGVVDVCLIPEISFKFDKLIDHVRSILKKQGHAVICVAEGAGQDLFKHDNATDASGNPILKDVGRYMLNVLKEEFGSGADIKYIDPTYMIRAIPTTTNDRIYCKVLGQGAVHGAFAGYTGFTVGLVNTHYVLLPIPIVIQTTRTVNPQGRRWNRLKTAINQPNLE